MLARQTRLAAASALDGAMRSGEVATIAAAPRTARRCFRVVTKVLPMEIEIETTP
jgi:hypothetical protein